MKKLLFLNRRGFTLIEMFIVVAIIGIFLAMSATVFIVIQSCTGALW